MVLRLGLAPLREVTRVTLALVFIGALVSGCSVEGSDDPLPPPASPSATSWTPQQPPSSAPEGPSASVEASPSAPGSAPPVASDFPTPSGWTPRPQKDPELGEIPWTGERDSREIAQIWSSYACGGSGLLPTPERVQEGAFTTDSGAAAVVERAEFSADQEAETFVDVYVDGSVECGAERVADTSLRRRIEGSVWTEHLRLDGDVVTMVIVQRQLSEGELEDLGRQLQALG